MASAKTPRDLFTGVHSIAIILLIAANIPLFLTDTHEKSADVPTARIGKR
jgi:hypothetical protein